MHPHGTGLLHLFPIGETVFITWRLRGSLPPGRCFPASKLGSAQAFDALDRVLDEARTGPLYLRQPPRAEMVAQAIHYNACILAHFHLYAFVVMANHVHMLVRPCISLSALTRSLKGVTARRANEILGLTGTPFWEADNYDRVVRSQGEFERIRFYIEQNPVRAGLVKAPADFRWSSASEAAGGSERGSGDAFRYRAGR